MQCTKAECSFEQFIVLQLIAVQCNVVQLSAVSFSSVQCSAALCSAGQCSTDQCSKVQCSALAVWHERTRKKGWEQVRRFCCCCKIRTTLSMRRNRENWRKIKCILNCRDNIFRVIACVLFDYDY